MSVAPKSFRVEYKNKRSRKNLDKKGINYLVKMLQNKEEKPIELEGIISLLDNEQDYEEIKSTHSKDEYFMGEKF